jgi:hypothetical protein
MPNPRAGAKFYLRFSQDAEIFISDFGFNYSLAVCTGSAERGAFLLVSPK